MRRYIGNLSSAFSVQHVVATQLCIRYSVQERYYELVGLCADFIRTICLIVPLLVTNPVC